MARDIINVIAFHAAIEGALESLPATLQCHRRTLKTYFHRTTDHHRSIRKAHRRKADPAWAQRKFDEGLTIYRFDESRRKNLIENIRWEFDNLERVAELERDPNRTAAWKATAFFRGLGHRRGDFGDLADLTWNFLARAQSAALKARRYEILREPAENMTGSLVASRCISLDAIIRIGRSADNCLSECEDRWKEFIFGTIDIWSLSEDDRLVAVLAVKRASNQVVEARGPLNKEIALCHVHDVASFCRKANLSISERCQGLLVEFAECPVVGPKIVLLDDCIVEYAEWPNAVRIDWSSALRMNILDENEKISEVRFTNSHSILSLAFDPASSCAREILDGRDAREAITAFGEAAVRKIVKTIAMDEIRPTLVQHRLLALTA